MLKQVMGLVKVITLNDCKVTIFILNFYSKYSIYIGVKLHEKFQDLSNKLTTL